MKVGDSFTRKEPVATGQSDDAFKITNFTITNITNKNVIIDGILSNGLSYNKKIALSDFNSYVKRFKKDN